jgi:hypothetical protein
VCSGDKKDSADPVVIGAGEIKIVAVPIFQDPKRFYDSGERFFKNTGVRPTFDDVGDNRDVPAALFYSVVDNTGRRWESVRVLGVMHTKHKKDLYEQQLWMDFERQYSGLSEVNEETDIALRVPERMLPLM